ncbi:MAG: metallophosphoesterase [Phycisphaerales bacterium]|nr:metallophosphoesterase [Phycisphaerales bacterium]
MSFIITLLILMLLADVWWWFTADRMLKTLPRSVWWRAGLAAFMALCIGGLLLVLLGRMAGISYSVLGAAGLALLFIWHFLLLPVLAIPSVLAAIVSGACRLIAGPARIAPDNPAQCSPSGDAGEAISRRDLLRAAVATAPPLIAIAGTGHALQMLDEFRIRRLVIPLEGLPRDLDGMTIAHVSDVHVGTFTRGKTLERIRDATNSLRADLVVQTGDLINRHLSDLPAAAEMSNRMEGRFGQFICEGNHDLMEGRLEFERRAIASRLPLLLNEGAEIRVHGVPVQILGLRWGRPGWMQRQELRRSSDQVIEASMRELLARRRDDAFTILLAHHPHAFDVAAKHAIPLTLSGHTHGGQLHLSEHIGFGPRMFRYWSGLYRKNGSALVVSNGVGNWFPLRINAPAEIIHITLRRA